MPRRPVEAGDRVFGVAGESLRAGGHVVGVGSPKNEILRSEQKVSYLDHLGVQRPTRLICPRQSPVHLSSLGAPGIDVRVPLGYSEGREVVTSVSARGHVVVHTR